MSRLQVAHVVSTKKINEGWWGKRGKGRWEADEKSVGRTSNVCFRDLVACDHGDAL